MTTQRALAPLVAAFDGLLGLLYPPCCLVCRTLQPESALCAACANSISPVPEPICARCGQSLADKGSCNHCRARKPAFECARALGAYDGPLRHAIHRLKYRDRPQLAEPLGSLLADFARENASDLNDLQFDTIVPVPMHRVRQRLRGYNQSERLARVLARELSLPLVSDGLIRCRPTRPQVGLEGAKRRDNISGAFSVRDPALFAGKLVLVIDDVATTSSTLHECAKALKAAGAKSVYALTLAAG